MIHNSQYNTRWIRLCSLVVTVTLLFWISACGNNASEKAKVTAANSVIGSIDSPDHLNKVMDISGERLLILDFYADWCPPCKELDPILENIAKEKSETVKVYKINTDRNMGIASSFRVGGIPHVIFLKNRKTVLALTGLYPKKMYLKAVEQFSGTVNP